MSNQVLKQTEGMINFILMKRAATGIQEICTTYLDRITLQAMRTLLKFSAFY